jgi:hypothetical protein
VPPMQVYGPKGRWQKSRRITDDCLLSIVPHKAGATGNVCNQGDDGNVYLNPLAKPCPVLQKGWSPRELVYVVLDEHQDEQVESVRIAPTASS